MPSFSDTTIRLLGQEPLAGRVHRRPSHLGVEENVIERFVGAGVRPENISRFSAASTWICTLYSILRDEWKSEADYRTRFDFLESQ